MSFSASIPLVPAQTAVSRVTMDFASLKEQVSNLTLYDIKAGVRKVQNGTSLLFRIPRLDAGKYYERSADRLCL